MAEQSEYTHVGVLKTTKKKIAILKSVANNGQGMEINQLLETWAQNAWEEAKKAGLVTDAMLGIAPVKGKKSSPAVAVETVA